MKVLPLSEVKMKLSQLVEEVVVTGRGNYHYAQWETGGDHREP